MADVAVRAAATQTVPADYTIPGAQELLPKSVAAAMDGTSAAVAWFPCLQVLDPGGNVMFSAVATASVAAGASADVSWFPRVGGSAGGGGTGGGAKNLSLPFQIPDASGNAHIGLVNTANTRMILPAFLNGVDGFWWGVLDVPSNYTSTPSITLWIAPASNTAQVARFIVGSRAAGTGGTWDAAYTTETAQNVTMSGTGLLPVAATFSLSTSPAASQSLQFFVERNGSNVADTLTVDALLFKAMFTYA